MEKAGGRMQHTRTVTPQRPQSRTHTRWRARQRGATAEARKGGAARQGIGEGGAVERDDSERDAGEGDTGERDADPARNKKQPHVSEKAQAQLVRLCSGFGASRFGVELSSFRHAQVARIAWWC